MEETQGVRIPFSLAIHGGASNDTNRKENSSIHQGKKEALHLALEKGYRILQEEGSSLDAVQEAVVVLENSEFFNAGKGAVLTREKTIELDASLMSSHLRAGAVAGVKETKNPILLARQVMEKTPYVLLVGESADQFALTQGLERVPNTYFMTQKCLEDWQKAKEKENSSTNLDQKLEFGTVGAVALDQKGDLAAATSTGGLNYKMAGRIGDSAVIGAGTYATAYCAVSCTGRGEAFILQSVASYVCHLVRSGISLEEAASRAIFEELPLIGGKGGLIAMNQLGQCVMPFNTAFMSRGYWQAEGKPVINVN